MSARKTVAPRIVRRRNGPDARAMTLRGPWCECGRFKERSALACDRCRFLDGMDLQKSAGEVLSELRQIGCATGETLAFEMPSLCRRTIARALADLRAAGRVRRAEVEASTDAARSSPTVVEFTLVERMAR